MAGPCNPKIPTLALREKALLKPQPLTMVSGVIHGWDVTTFCNAKLTASANFTMPLPTGLYPGANGMLTIVQDATGSRIITWATGYVASGTKPVLSTAANAKDQIAWYSDDGATVTLSGVMGVS